MQPPSAARKPELLPATVFSIRFPAAAGRSLWIAALKTMHPAHPIGVYFETENIYTLNPSSQYSLDISAFCRGKIGRLLQSRRVLRSIPCPLRSRAGY